MDELHAGMSMDSGAPSARPAHGTWPGIQSRPETASMHALRFTGQGTRHFPSNAIMCHCRHTCRSCAAGQLLPHLGLLVALQHLQACTQGPILCRALQGMQFGTCMNLQQHAGS